ncbi:MAG: hypothetical protein WBP83_00730 [Nitrososphaeraceae archaeon]
MVRREITSAKCATKENGTVKKVIKNKPNLTLGNLRGYQYLMNIVAA